MKYKITSIALLLGMCVSLSGQAKFVVPVKKQEESIALAKKLLDTSDIEKVPSFEKPDPFNHLVEVPDEVVEEVVDNSPVLLATDKEVLEAASKYLKPSGFVNSNGEEFLIMNGGKVKAGTRFDFRYRGQAYRLHISDITKTQFTLKLNQETITLSME